MRGALCDCTGLAPRWPALLKGIPNSSLGRSTHLPPDHRICPFLSFLFQWMAALSSSPLFTVPPSPRRCQLRPLATPRAAAPSHHHLLSGQRQHPSLDPRTLSPHHSTIPAFSQSGFVGLFFQNINLIMPTHPPLHPLPHNPLLKTPEHFPIESLFPTQSFFF